jgi:hypothetical protein
MELAEQEFVTWLIICSKGGLWITNAEIKDKIICNKLGFVRNGKRISLPSTFAPF